MGSEFKAKAILAAVREKSTVVEKSSRFSVLGRVILRRAKVWATPLFSLRRFGGTDSLRHEPPPPVLSALSRPELEALLVELFGEVTALHQTVAGQREEIARLKGLKGRSNIKPSSMDKGTEPLKSPKKE